MSALEKIIEKQARGEPLTSLEFAVFWCSDSVASINAAEELAAKDAELSALRERVAAYHEQIAEVNELLWEFTENPNIEMGEKGHEKIEDYFKKYSSNAERPAP